MIENDQGNLREIAASSDAILPRLAARPGAGCLRISGEAADGASLEEVIYLRGGELVGCGSEPEAGADAAAATMRRAVAALTLPFGFFTWSEEEPPPGKSVASIPVAELMLEYARAVPDPGELLPAFNPPGGHLRLGDSIEQIRAKLKLQQPEWKVIFRVNGRRSAEEIGTSLAIEGEALARLLYTCLLVGAVQSGIGKGPASSSSFSWPAAPRPGQPSPAPPPVPGPSAAAASSPSPSASAAPRRRRALVVDDSRTVQRVVEIALKEIGLDVELADSGEQAIELATATRPDVVILDVIMGGMDGYKTCEALRRVFNPVRVPIIMLTSKEGTFNALRGKMAGATAYLTKPFENEELHKAVRDNLAPA